MSGQLASSAGIRIIGVIADLVTNMDCTIAVVVGMTTVTVPTIVVTVVSTIVRELSDGVDRRCPTGGDTVNAEHIVVTVVNIVIREVSDGVDRRCPNGGATVDADAGSGCGRLGCREADCLGEVHDFLLVRTTKLLEGSLGLCGGCLPSGSFRHSPSPGGVQGRGCRCEEIRVKIRATALRGRLGRVIGIRANGSVRCCVRYVGVVKIRNEETELFFEEPFMPDRFVFLPSVRDSDCAAFGVKPNDRGGDRNALDGDVDLITNCEEAKP